MSNHRLLSVAINPDVQAINPDGPRKKIHQYIQMKKESINQSIKEDTQKPTTSTSKHLTAPISKKQQRSGEGWWVKPMDCPYVDAVWTPKCAAKTTTWKLIANPPKKKIYFTSDEE